MNLRSQTPYQTRTFYLIWVFFSFFYVNVVKNPTWSSNLLMFKTRLWPVKTRAQKGCARKWDAVDKMITVFHGSKNFISLHNYLRILKQSKSYWLDSFISSKILKSSFTLIDKGQFIYPENSTYFHSFFVEVNILWLYNQNPTCILVCCLLVWES